MTAPMAPYVDSQQVWERQPWVTPQELAELSRVPTRKVAFFIVLTWVGLLTSIGLALWSHSLVVDALAYFADGVLFVTLSYWDHEATHYLLSRDRKLNDLIADVFLAGPIGMTVGQHRWQHVRHHANLNDPAHEIDFTTWICVGGPQLAVQVFLHAIGWYGIVTIFRYRPDGRVPQKTDVPPRTVASMVSFVVANVGLFAVCAALGQWYMYFVLWVCPLFSVSVALMNIVNIVEHQASSAVCETGVVKMPAITRVVRMGLLERYLIAPIGVAFHFEHHQFPGIPASRLPELHRLLKARGRFEEKDVVWADGFLRTVWRLSRRSFGTAFAAEKPTAAVELT